MIHFHSTMRTTCPHADDPMSTGTTQASRVTCPRCLAAIRAFDRATDETAKSATAITAKLRVVTP